MAVSRNETLKLILAALKLFPKIIKERERAHRENEKVLKRFESLSKHLKRETEKRIQSSSSQNSDFTVVREHPRHVPVSEKNPDGITIVDRHPRRLPGSYLDANEIDRILREYDRKNIVYPKANNLKFSSGNDYDDMIAVWTDYFNQKFPNEPALDPDIVKALIASESEFKTDPINDRAAGITQITPQTFKASQNPKGEVKEFIFVGMKKKDLKNPKIAIPMGVRWLFKKKKDAARKLKRDPTPDEIILEYKGLLGSKTTLKRKALLNFQTNYATLKK